MLHDKNQVRSELARCQGSRGNTPPKMGSLVRPGAAGLLIGIECSRVRDSSWMYLTSLVTTRIGVALATIQRKLPDRVVVGLQLYSAVLVARTYLNLCVPCTIEF